MRRCSRLRTWSLVWGLPSAFSGMRSNRRRERGESCIVLPPRRTRDDLGHDSRPPRRRRCSPARFGAFRSGFRPGLAVVVLAVVRRVALGAAVYAAARAWDAGTVRVAAVDLTVAVVIDRVGASHHAVLGPGRRAAGGRALTVRVAAVELAVTVVVDRVHAGERRVLGARDAAAELAGAVPPVVAVDITVAVIVQGRQRRPPVVLCAIFNAASERLGTVGVAAVAVLVAVVVDASLAERRFARASWHACAVAPDR